MSDFALDAATGDLELTKGRTRLAAGVEAVALSWRSRLLIFKGEWFLDRSKGTDYQNDILEKGVRMNIVRAIFADITRKTPGVTDLLDLRLKFNPATRVLEVFAEALVEGERTTLTFSASDAANQGETLFGQLDWSQQQQSGWLGFPV